MTRYFQFDEYKNCRNLSFPEFSRWLDDFGERLTAIWNLTTNYLHCIHRIFRLFKQVQNFSPVLILLCLTQVSNLLLANLLLAWASLPYIVYWLSHELLILSIIVLSSSSASIHPLLDVGLSSDLPSLPILSRTNPTLPDNGCYVVDPALLWLCCYSFVEPIRCPQLLMLNLSNPNSILLEFLLLLLLLLRWHYRV